MMLMQAAANTRLEALRQQLEMKLLIAKAQQDLNMAMLAAGLTPADFLIDDSAVRLADAIEGARR